MFVHCRVIQKIFEEVDKHIDEDTLLKELNMSALPILNDQFVKLIKLLVYILNLKVYYFTAVNGDMIVDALSGQSCYLRWIINKKTGIRLSYFSKTCWRL